eukprot:COSAG04_NODE_3883_length_2451_cov_2.389031_2_plen_68_part_00
MLADITARWKLGVGAETGMGTSPRCGFRRYIQETSVRVHVVDLGQHAHGAAPGWARRRVVGVWGVQS